MALKPTNTPKIECRICGCRMSSVTDSHMHEVIYLGKKRTIIKRYRKCRHCGFQYTTVETYEDEENTGLPEGVTPFRPAPPTPGVYSPPTIPEAAGSPSPEKRPKAKRKRKG